MALRERRAHLAGRGIELRVGLGAGAAANTAIAVAGLERTAALVAVLELQPPTAASGAAIVGDRRADVTAVADGSLKLGVDTTGNQLLVLWWA